MLLRGSVPFMWSPGAQESFETVKRLIVNSAALTLFNPELTTIVTTDASDYAIGGVLTQLHAITRRKQWNLPHAPLQQQKGSTPR